MRIAAGAFGFFTLIQLLDRAATMGREKVFNELQRPVFSLVNRTPLSRRCTFISYDSVGTIRNLEHLAYTNDRIINEYEEQAEE